MPITEMFFSLHVDHPGDVGGPPAGEILQLFGTVWSGGKGLPIRYPQYRRVHAIRGAIGGWTFPESAASRSDAVQAVVSFPACDDGNKQAGHLDSANAAAVEFWAVSSADALLFVGKLRPPIHVGSGVTPQVVLFPLDDVATAIEQDLRRAPVSAADRAALLAIRGVVADAAGHPARDAALKAIDRLGGGTTP